MQKDDVTHTIGQLLGLSVQADAAAETPVQGVAYRSDRVREGDVFFCISGFSHDGHDFAGDAVARGAAVLVVERKLDVPVPQVVVTDSRAALAKASAAFLGDPSSALEVIGITGTNGKTTSTYLVDSILRASGRRTGLIGTVETRVDGSVVPSSRTTPESADLQDLFAEMRGVGVDAVVMEVSSHAIDLHRVDAVHFRVAAFSNLTQDHLDYHHTIEEYFSVKRRLFSDFEVDTRVVNGDDPFGAIMAAEFDDALVFGHGPEAAVRAEAERLDATGASFELVTPQGSAPIRLPLAGAYNVSNALLAAASCHALGVSLHHIVEGLEGAPQVPGRLERIECGQDFSVVVDYAHTPDSLHKAIAAMKAVCEGRVIVVFGCGGDRDPEKRPLMGRAAAEGADHVVVTSDNPRSEDPVGIILQVEDGVRGGSATYEVEVDRRRAIERAIRAARTGDAVLIAGKGHEDYQIFSDRTIHFDDREVAREVLGTC